MKASLPTTINWIFILFIIICLNSCGNILGGTTSALQYKTLVRSQSPINFYSFEESSGSIAYDSGTTLINANFTGSATMQTSQPGKSGYCFNFVTNTWIAPSPAINMGANWSISFWLKTPLPSNGAWKTIVRGSSHHQVIFDSSTNEFGAYIGSFRTSGVDTDLLSAGWHHFTSVGSATAILFYVDGTYRSTSSVGSVDTINTIGNYSSGSQPVYMMDEIAFFNRALTSTEILQQFLAQ